MTSSNLNLLTFCVLFLTINIAAADEQCSFTYTSGLGASVGLPNTYTCKVYNSTELPQVNAHRPGLNDLNVTYVEVNFDGFYDEFTQFYCLSFPNLNEFEIRNIKINKFDKNFFNLCGKLSEISISSNGLKELPEDLFAGSPNVQELGISENNLETLPENIFANLNQLTSLHLDRNQIKNLPPKIFSPLTKMAVLSLSGNQIASVNPKLFQNIPNLEYFFMGNNKIQEIQDNAFAGLPKLRNLNLDHNNIKKLNRNSFANLKKVSSLSLSGNDLESFPSSVFEPLEDITILSLDKNQIKVVQADWFGSKKNRIFVLDMSNNKIDRIDRNLFDKIEPTHLLVKENVCVDAEIRRASKEERDEMLKRCYMNFNERGDDDRIVFPGK